jgi:hypothetical protein
MILFNIKDKKAAASIAAAVSTFLMLVKIVRDGRNINFSTTAILPLSVFEKNQT